MNDADRLNGPGVVGLVLRRMALRHWRASPGQSLLLILILALGVGVYFSIRLANRAAIASFRHFTELIAADVDWIIHAPAGDLPESVLGELRTALGPSAVHLIPVVESTATRPPGNDLQPIGSRETFRLLGVDLVGIQNPVRDAGHAASWFDDSPAEGISRRSSSDRDSGDDRFWEILRNPRAVFISAELARRDGLGVGDDLELIINDVMCSLEVAGIIPEIRGQPSPPATLLVMDLPALQKLTGREGRLTRVEFRVESGPGDDLRREALGEFFEALAKREAAPAVMREPGRADLHGEHAGRVEVSADTLEGSARRWVVASPADRRAAGAVMTRAFRLNLTILSLIALLVGLYLVVQALDGAVVRRRGEIAVLRALGVDAHVIAWAWLLEAAAAGLVGGLLGVLLGWAGAQFSVRFVGRTVNALYYATDVRAAGLHAGELLCAVGLAVAASVLAGWWPARSAAMTPPAQLLARQATARPSWAFQHLGLGLGLLLAGMAFAMAPAVPLGAGGRFPLGGYAAALCWLVGAGIVGGRLLGWLGRMLRGVGRMDVTVRLAASHLIRPSGRHVLATAGFICAVAMTAGMVIMVGSFDRTMRGWIERTFQSDLYVSSAGAQSASTDNRLAPERWKALVEHPAVADANVIHGSEILLGDTTTILAGSDFGYLARNVRFAWAEPPEESVAAGRDSEDREEMTEGGGLSGGLSDTGESVPAFASESFASRFGIHRGGTVVIPTPSGSRRLMITGVFSDYGNERGTLLVDRRQFTNWFQSPFASSVVVKLKDPTQAESVRAEWLAAHPGLQVLTHAHLREEVLRIFRETFAITYVLETIALAVAVLGLALTMASILLSRRDEWTTLRALGMRHSELARAAAVEGGFIVLCGLLAGGVTSLALGWLLIHVINRQTFGWTLEFSMPLGQLALLAVGVVVVSLAVSFAVGRWGARLPAEREE